MTEKRLVQRNREIGFVVAREDTERRIEREFQLITGTIQRELAQYPALHRRLVEQMNAVDEDYASSAEVPPQPSNWQRAVRSVAEIPLQDDAVVADVLDTIHYSMRRAESRALESYRESTRVRHQLLRRMLPKWRAMLTVLERINKNVESVILRAKTLDRLMLKYEEILQKNDRSLRMLSASSFTRFLIAAFAVAVAAGGILVNFQLIVRPVTEVLGGTAFLGEYATAEIFAFVMIFIQVSLGLMVMECLQVTRLFPTLGYLADRIRKRLLWAALLLLFLFAGVEASLAFSRELLVQRDPLLTGVVGQSASASADSGLPWALTLAQMGLGFLLPLILAFTAVPLEQCIVSGRMVFGMFLVFLLRVLSQCVRLLAKVSLQVGILCNRVYDLVIFPLLWLQTFYLRRRWEKRAAALGAKTVADRIGEYKDSSSAQSASKAQPVAKEV
ncbi:hypothetical protein [Microbulbifer sp. 2205BS26-8]|uniref:hypothetical protein n=1 Tax=Microbulbifer sp. 2205BS26-8 TaxID=3064386 RepID=UPI00273FE3F1|nr:hypothetical protein [Microbulbifer sp. 2205BS26-8]MDP5209571.1 hypothetical protein [Microbulbifer sp. 2205BS26-8]